jgi:hypothetical protein
LWPPAAIGESPQCKDAVLADKTHKLIIDALRKAAVHRGGMAAFAARSELGLFPSTAIGRPAAERAAQDGLFNSDAEDWIITDAGFAMLLERTSPRQVLEDCVRALEARQDQLDDLRTTMSEMFGSLNGLRVTIEQSLPAIGNPRSLVVTSSNCDRAVVDALGRWQAEAGEDCPLPELYRQTELIESGLSIGAFHDAVRRLQAAGRLYLHPWTGPLYRMPEPSYALMSGHEIAYYASGRAAPAQPDYSTEETLASAGRA